MTITNPRAIFQSRFTRSRCTYTVDVCLDRSLTLVVVVHRNGRAIAIGADRCFEWTLFGGRSTLWEAALNTIPVPTSFESML